jgi:hypothetical protein
MKYRDLVAFEPLETVKELRRSDDMDQAKEDVRTYVISDRMADQLAGVIFPNLQFVEPADNKGLLIVANYGTGKTHLMSVVAAVAEHDDLVELLTNGQVHESARSVAGRFKVIRAEIGATGIPHLRDVVVAQLEEGLKELGVDYTFPDFATQTNSKDSLQAMMEAFEGKYPDKGLLFVLDELLDYLRQLHDAELIQSLQFLREVGEISSTSRFRFIAGIQEAIFDNPRFASAGDNVRRVRDRFEQARISREDIEFVVQERLLKKDGAQRDQIRDHLQKFTPLYDEMAERIEDYVRLFPVHPSYLRTFERISVIEKRTVLRTLSREISARLDQDVPDSEPGLICYDSYYRTVADDPSNRTIERVTEVLDKAEHLKSIVEHSMPESNYKGTASRVIDALAVHRLTTEDNTSPVGLTVENLRDDLTLLPPGLPKKDARFLATTTRTVMDRILSTVSGQFISKNEENDQYYLDVYKDIDYDQKIAERANHLDTERLDEAYYQAVEELLELRDQPYVSGYRIWQYELPWADKNVTRVGYLFMGAPNERSTAQPPRDFYVYFLQPFDEPKFQDEQRQDEVFLRLDRMDDDFRQHLKHYAGAAALERESAGTTHRPIYADKREVALGHIVDWLRQNVASALSATYAGDKRSVAEWLPPGTAVDGNLRDTIVELAASVLAEHFGNRYPDYPKFEARITEGNKPESVRMALGYTSGRQATLGKQVLEALELLDSDGGITADGKYAQALLDQLKDASGKVLNRRDLLTERDKGLLNWGSWHLEPVWLVVVAAALVQRGQAEIAFRDKRIDAIATDQLVSMSIDDLEAFIQISPPKATPVNMIREVAALYGINPAGIPDSGLDDEKLRGLLDKINGLYVEATSARDALADRGTLWGEIVFDKVDERQSRLDSLIKLSEDLRARNTVGKMNRISATDQDIYHAKEGIAELTLVADILKAKDRLSPSSEYLKNASEHFGFDFDLSERAEVLKSEVIDVVRIGNATDANKVVELSQRCDQLRLEFADASARSYRHAHLDAGGDARKRQLLEGNDLALLKSLSVIEILPANELTLIQNRLADLKSMFEFDESKLRESVVYPDKSGFTPGPINGMSAQAQLADLENRISQLVTDWQTTLVDNLKESNVQEETDLLDDPERETVKGIVDSKRLPNPISVSTVKAINQVFNRFEKREITQTMLWDAVFPDKKPTTIAEFEERMRKLAEDYGRGSAEADRIRIVPEGEGI